MSHTWRNGHYVAQTSRRQIGQRTPRDKFPVGFEREVTLGARGNAHRPGIRTEDGGSCAKVFKIDAAATNEFSFDKLNLVQFVFDFEERRGVNRPANVDRSVNIENRVFVDQGWQIILS